MSLFAVKYHYSKLLRINNILFVCGCLVVLTACNNEPSTSDTVNTFSSLDQDNVLYFEQLKAGFPELVVAPSHNDELLSCKATSTIDPNSTITGRVEFERILFGRYGLDYRHRAVLPARGVVVEAVDASQGYCSEEVVTTGLTNGNGDYGLLVPVNQAVCINVRAQLYRDNNHRDSNQGGAAWDIQVANNTIGNTPYYLQDETVATPNDLAVRNVLALSGALVGSSDYTEPRSAAPFAILDTLCEVTDAIVATDSEVVLPPLFIRWSANNVAVTGNVEEGDIGNASSRQLRLIDLNNEVLATVNEMFLLGDEDNNTDEYDQHVIAHEYAHYISNNLSRSDAIGGQHSLSDRLDMRVAFEEGWGDALAAITLSDVDEAIIPNAAIYQDSLGPDQASVFRFAIDRNFRPVAGWYSEASVFSIIYNLSNELTGGLASLMNVLRAEDYLASDALTSIYPFIYHLKQQHPDKAIVIDEILYEQDIDAVIDSYGSDEDLSDNDINGDQDIDAIYHPVLLSHRQQVCSNSQYGFANKLSVHQFMLFDAGDTMQNYQFTFIPESNGQVEVVFYQQGEVLDKLTASSAGDRAAIVLPLTGRIVIALTDAGNNSVDSISNTQQCFSVRVDES